MSKKHKHKGGASADSYFLEDPPKKKKKKLSKEEKTAKKMAKEEVRAEAVEKKADKQYKKTRKEMKKILVDYRTPDELTIYEKKFYKKIGKPIKGQDYLEMFDDTMIHDLRLITRAVFGDENISSNHKKADMIVEELSPVGFREVGLGTNIIVLRHKKYPGVVFKIALDKFGIDDNINDEWLYKKHSDMYARFICRHPSGIVSVQEAYAMVHDTGRMSDFIGQAYDMITRLERSYIIVDLSPVNFKNYAVSRDGRLVIIDGSDLIPIPRGVDLMRCKRIVGSKNGKRVYCDAKMHYTADYNRVECPVCNRVLLPYELKPRIQYDEKEEQMALITTGLTPKEKRELDQYVEELRVANGFAPKQDEVGGSEKEHVTYDVAECDEDRMRESLNTVLARYGREPIKKPKAFNPFADDDEDEDLPEGEPPEENLEDADAETESMSDGFEFAPTAVFNREAHVPEELRNKFEAYEDDEDDTEDDEEEDDVEPVESRELVADVSDDVEVIMATSIEKRTSTSMGEDEPEIAVAMRRPAYLDVEFSEDPCALNISITGPLKEAFSEDGPAIYVALDGGDDYIEVISPDLLGKLVMQLLDQKGINYHSN